MRIDPELLKTAVDPWGVVNGHRVPFEALGAYEASRYVLRLRSDVKKILGAQGCPFPQRGHENEHQAAFSTYLHETIHWWQHVGTSFGLIAGTLFSSYHHVLYDNLKDVLRTSGPIKPLRYLLQKEHKHLFGGNPQQLEWIVRLPNELAAYLYLSNDPSSKDTVTGWTHFYALWHSVRTAIQVTNEAISMTLGGPESPMPRTNDWENVFQSLYPHSAEDFQTARLSGLPSFGARAILEGQACFSQAQYLAGVTEGAVSLGHLRGGMIYGIYEEAFERFLAALDCEWPESADDRLVNLFLLLCDLSLCSPEGLFGPISELSHFTSRNLPGSRFDALCAVARKLDLAHSDVSCEAQTYWALSDQLCTAIGCGGPKSIASAVAEWTSTNSHWRQLAIEGKSFEFANANLPIRVLLSRFQGIQLEKLRKAEFFCWPGACLGGLSSSCSEAEARELFLEHGALFTEDVDGSVRPRLIPGRSQEKLVRLLTDFYCSHAVYNLTTQWIFFPGSFEYDLSWLSLDDSHSDLKGWADRNFHAIWKVSPDDFKVL